MRLPPLHLSSSGGKAVPCLEGGGSLQLGRSQKYLINICDHLPVPFSKNHATVTET